MTTHQNFVQGTRLFYQNQYQKGLQQINICLSVNPQNAMLFSNRSLFYSQMGNLSKAMQDLQKSIELDHLNYVSYFNLFSLLYRTSKMKEALMNLCCSLSCLYLTRARFRKRQLDAQKAIKYAQNNIEAHVLKGLMHLQNNRIKLAINQLDWAYQISKNNQTLNKIRKILHKKSNISYQQNTTALTQRQSQARLISTYQPQEQDLMIEIKMKISQFNDIYNDLNEQQGTLTQRVPRTLLPNQLQEMVKLNMQEPIMQIYQLKYNEVNHQPVVYQMKQEYRKQRNIQQNQCQQQEHQNFLFKEGLLNDQQNNSSQKNLQSDKFPEDNQREFSQKDKQQFKANQQEIYHQNQLSDDSLRDNLSQDKNFQRQLNNMQEFSGNQLQNNEQQKLSQLENCNQQQSYQDFLVIEQYPSNIQVNQLIQNKSFKDQTQKNEESPQSYNQSSVIDYSSSEISSREGVSSINLYPMKSKTFGRFKIIRVDFLQYSFAKQHQEMYCKVKYNNNNEKQQNILTTCDSLYSQELKNCEWNEVFREIKLHDNPSILKVQLYGKNFQSYKDDLIGEAQILIECSGQIKLNLFKSNKIIGYLYIKLYII